MLTRFFVDSKILTDRQTDRISLLFSHAPNCGLLSNFIDYLLYIRHDCAIWCSHAFLVFERKRNGTTVDVRNEPQPCDKSLTQAIRLYA